MKKPKGRKKKGNGTKPDLWKRIGYVPSKPSAHEMHRISYEARLSLPEGRGTGRSAGSNKRLMWLLRRR